MAIDTHQNVHRSTPHYINPTNAKLETSMSLWSVVVILAVAVLGYIAYAAYFGTANYSPTSDTVVAPMVDNSRMGTAPIVNR